MPETGGRFVAGGVSPPLRFSAQCTDARRMKCLKSPKAAPSRRGGGGRDMGLYHNSERNYLAASTIFMVWTSDSHPQKVVTSPVTVGISTRWELAMMMFWR